MKHYICNRQTKEKYEESNPTGTGFLYNSFPGNLLLNLVNKRFFSKLGGRLMDTKYSTRYIKGFIKKNNIDMYDYQKVEYKSFNDFFSRKIIEDKRNFDKSKSKLISPADSKLTYYRLTEDLKFTIKGKEYSLESFLGNKKLADNYKDGTLLIFRLAVSDYHRYCFIDNGKLLKTKRINGKYHSVSPVALVKRKVLTENERIYSILKTENFGEIVQVEVGALMVGRIVNNNLKSFKKGQEKGYFEFGGSTIVVLVKKDIIEVDKDIVLNSKEEIETIVKCRETIGKKK